MPECRQCSGDKEENAFYKNASKQLGRSSECKECSKLNSKEYYIDNREKLLARSAKWVRDNPEKHKNNEMVRKYGITVSQYRVLEKAQNYSCAICTKSVADNKEDLAVDHCHTTGKVRGLLCKPCNRGIGMLQDSPDVIQKALEYLQGAV